ncbi:hypothetical protein MIND_00746100 [Mycena indigotica]|uniref:ER membrane protein complex subunit 10 n=1 Tax=Mycena indigotica TaxID=2126181 RepID=A0A8H6SM09_9AGAR|nr:uncharacterized protein MIND_00746100 [Mycena indigotica]KAF7301804.1 hypothetical protein MIND_00746100 [Mycena indigotica]
MLRVLASVLFALPVAFSAQYNVYHRLYQPHLPESTFSPRGTLLIPETGPASFLPSPTLAQDLTQLSDELETVKGTLYQIALQLDDANPGQWDLVSAVKVCHLHQATAEKFIIQTTRAGQPYALDYFVAPTSHNGACPKKVKKPILAFANNVAALNSTIELRAIRTPPSLELHVPPPLTPEGQPVVPEPEKTFFQRYWLYGAAILIALMISGGPEEEQKK